MSHLHYPFKIVSVTITTILIVSLLLTLCSCTVEEPSRKTEKRAAKHVSQHGRALTTTKPGGKPTTSKPGGPVTSPKPGGPVTSPKPGGPVTTPKPGGPVTSPKPGGPVTSPKPGVPVTSPKPGVPVTSPKTPKPGVPVTSPKTPKPVGPITTPNPGGENSTNPETNETKPGRPPPQELAGFEFIGYHSDIGYWVTKEQFDKAGAVLACDKIREITKYPGHLASLVLQEEVFAIDKLLADHKDENGSVITNVYIAEIIEVTAAGRTILTADTPYGRRTEDVSDTDSDLFLGKEGKDKKRYANFQNHKHKRRVLISRPKRQNQDDADFDTDDPEARITVETGPPNSVVARQTHFPWLAEWKMEGEASSKCSPDLTGCKPRNCTVTTEACRVIQGTCQVEKFVNCVEMNTTGCSAVCANCNVTQPKCAQMDHKCNLIEPRKCTVSEPECSVVTPKCTVSRKPCVTKYPECHLAQKNTTCQVAKPCAKPQGSECKKEKRKCRDEELAAGKPEGSCFNYVCESKAICLTPTYCVEDHVICPYPTTFCPPEVVHCPEPYVNCSKPTTTCTEPVFDCPAPQIECTEPFVYCSAPSITCPTVITQCENPVINCLPPKIYCPPPKLECDEPEPCEIPPPPPCEPVKPEVCEDDCNCIMLARQNSPTNGLFYAKKGSVCSQLLKGLCLSNVGSKSRGGDGGGGSGVTPKTPKPEGAKRKG